MYTLYKFHFLNGISEINQLFDDILIIWPAPVYAYIVTLILFICLIKYKIPRCTVYRKSAKKYWDINFCSYCPSPTLKKRTFGNSLLDAPSCGLSRGAKSSLTEFMPFKFVYNSNFDSILVKKMCLCECECVCVMLVLRGWMQTHTKKNSEMGTNDILLWICFEKIVI